MPALLWKERDQLQPEQAAAYLARIGLDPDATLTRSRDATLLKDLQVAHILTVPFETTLLHVADFEDLKDSLLSLGQGPGIDSCVEQGYKQVVEQRRGGYCFSLNTLFSALLRFLGFRVSEVQARKYKHERADPAVAGWDYVPAVHMVLIVDAESQRYLVDVGFGGTGSTFPIELKDQATAASLSSTEEFEMRHEVLPGADPNELIDLEPGWTLWVRYTRQNGQRVRSPVYHLVLRSLPTIDLETLNFFSSHDPRAPHRNKLLLTTVLPDGGRKVLLYTQEDALQGKPAADFYVRNGQGAIVQQRQVPFRAKDLRELCRDEFDFGGFA